MAIHQDLTAKKTKLKQEYVYILREKLKLADYLMFLKQVKSYTSKESS